VNEADRDTHQYGLRLITGEESRIEEGTLVKRNVVTKRIQRCANHATYKGNGREPTE